MAISKRRANIPINYDVRPILIKKKKKSSCQETSLTSCMRENFFFYFFISKVCVCVTFHDKSNPTLPTCHELTLTLILILILTIRSFDLL